jgi:hypothetical protein
MDKKTQINFWYVIAAVLGILLSRTSICKARS